MFLKQSETLLMIETKHVMNTIHTSMCNDAKSGFHLNRSFAILSDAYIECQYILVVSV